MRTITEFFGRSLKAIEEKIPAMKAELTASVTEQLKGEGKSEEEIAAGLDEAVKAALQAKIGEENKAEGDKLAVLMGALEIARSARGNLKRIVVMAKSKDDEKAPSGAKEIDGKFFVVENFPEAQRAAPARDARDERGGRGRGDKRGGRGGKGGRDGDKRGSEGRRPRREGAAPAEGALKIDVKAGGSLPPDHVAVPKGEGKPRKPRAPRAPVEPYKGPNRISIGGVAVPGSVGSVVSSSVVSSGASSAPAPAESPAPAPEAAASSDPSAT